MSSKQLWSPPRLRLTGETLRLFFAITVSSLLLLPVGTASAQPATASSVVYEFGRPVRADEHTYDWYRRTHADATGESRFSAGSGNRTMSPKTAHWRD